MKICYQDRQFTEARLRVIEQANEIIETYMAQGYRLTLRQLYYQFVSRDLIPNRVTEYKRLGSIVNDARLAGLLDWDAIEDRTRNLQSNPHWKSPTEIMEAAASGFALDKWATQPVRVEVWIEKEALSGVFERVCNELDVPFFCCRGYTSQSEMWSGAMRLKRFRKSNQTPYVLHFGDHDPSGIDMTRDIEDRMRIFGLPVHLERLALNMDQVEQYDPPPNPAKETDSRFAAYIREYGESSWELDALEPAVLADLVRARIRELIEPNAWEETIAKETEHRRLLIEASERWEEVVNFLNS